MNVHGRCAGAAALLAACLSGCQLPEGTGAAERAYVTKTAGTGFFTLPADYRVGGNPDVSPYPDDELCFDGVYSDLWKQYSLEPLTVLREWLARRDIGLVLLLYPDPWEIAARVDKPGHDFPPGCAELAARELTAAGFQVVDTTAAILAAAPEYPLCFYYDRWNDIHPEYGAVEPAARLLAQALKPWRIAPEPGQKFTLETVPTLAERYHPATGARLLTTHVLLNGATPPLRAPASPVLVIGNSISATPYTGELAAQLGKELGVMPDYLRCDGDGLALGVPRRLAMREHEYLDGKKVVALVLSYPQLFYRWQRIDWVEELAAAVGDMEPRIAPEQWRSRLTEVETPADGWGVELSRLWRSAERYTETEQRFIEDKEALYGPLTFFKSSGAGWRARFAVGEVVPGAIWKLTVVTTAPPGYLHIRAGDYETALNDYEETWYLPAAETLEITADLPELVIGLGELSIYVPEKP